MTAIQKAREALELIKTMVCGDRAPYWNSGMAVTSARSSIANVCDAALAALDAETPATPADVGELVERLRERWEATDAPVAKKINRYLKLCREAATALERVVRDRDEALADLKSSIEAHHKTSHESVRRIQAIGREKSAVETSLLAAEAKLAEARKEADTLRARLETVEAETRERCAKAVNDLDVGPLHDGVIVEALEAIRNLEPRHD